MLSSLKKGVARFSLWLAVPVVASLASLGIISLAGQSNTWSPTTGTVSGLQLTINYNNAFSAVQSCNSGAVAPANDQSAAAVQGQCWLNTSTTPYTVEQYDGTQWVTIGWLDTTNHQWIGNNAGGTGTLASAGTTDLGTVQNPVISISGTTTITSFGSSALTGATKYLNFTGALTLTNNATSLILPNGGANITTAAGDTAIAVYLGGGNWRVASYTKAAGLAANSITAVQLASSAVPCGSPMVNGTLTASVSANALTINLKTVAGNTPSASDPVWIQIPFYSAGTAGCAIFEITSSVSITAPSGATLGTVNAQANRIWVGAISTGSTAILGVYNSLSGTNILPWNEPAGTNATGISSGSTSSQIWYASSTQSGAFRVIGYVESTQTTAGTWATAPSNVQLFGPGVKRPGEAIQGPFRTEITSDPTTTSTTYVALTGLSKAITPTSAANVIHARSAGAWGTTAAGFAAFSLSRGTTAATGLFGDQSGGGSGSTGANQSYVVDGYDVPNTTGSTTYATQGRISTGTTLTLGTNNTITGMTVSLTVEELQI
jgi:hypothetical protein